MRLRTRITFQEPWSTIIPQVAQQCNLSVDDYCRRAIQLVTKQGLEQGAREQEQEAQNGAHNSESGVSSGNPEQIPSSVSIDSSALANQTSTNLDPQT